MNICDFIGTGKENAITRGELVAILNLPDRMTDDVGELKRQFATNKSRAMSILRQQVHIARKIVQLEDINKYQMTFDEVVRS